MRRIVVLPFAFILSVGCGSVSTTNQQSDSGADKPKATGAAGTGAAGTTGVAGTTGDAGTTGTAGTTGVAGTTGDAGTTGAAGTGMSDGGAPEVPPPPKMFALMVAPAGTGGGTITSVPAGISCGATCMASYTDGTMVTLTAMPDGQSLFTAWGGACMGSGTCVVTMDQARSVTATFTKQSYGLTVTRTGTGASVSTVTSVPAGIACGNDCSEPYAAGTSVTLTAAAGTGATFGGWGGACTGTGTCVVMINAIVNVTATFTLMQNTLTITKTGNGTGTVTSNPAGISCPPTCSEPVDYGTMVTLTAAPATGSTFMGWSGVAGCPGTTPCTVTVTAATAVTANVVLNAYPLSVTKTGNGTVSANVGGLSCGATCMANYNYGSPVTLTATADPGWAFGGWGGACSGTGTCAVNVMAATNVSATFTKSTWVVTVDLQGTGTGSVTINPGATVLSADGTATIAAGAAVTLTASAGAGFGFGGWGGACSGFGSCTFTLTTDLTVTANFAPPNKMFITSTQQAPGTLGGLAGADALCAARANAANLPGTFKAFLGATNANAWSRLAGARGWVRTDGKAFGDSVADLMAGRTFYPAVLTESGTEVPAGQTLSVTGLNGGAVATCTEWSSTGGGAFDATWGDPRSGWLAWAANGSTACNYTMMRLYCFEVSRSVAYRPPAIPAGGRRAFLSSGTITGGAGLAAADAACTSDATASALPGTYKAMLAGSGTSAASRFAGGTAWYRVDGVQLSATAADLLGGASSLWAAMSLRSDGLTQEQVIAWSGAPDVATAGTATTSCTTWTAGAGTGANMTYANRMGTDWFGPFATGNCGDPHRVFCFQQ